MQIIVIVAPAAAPRVLLIEAETVEAAIARAAVRLMPTPEWTIDRARTFALAV